MRKRDSIFEIQAAKREHTRHTRVDGEGIPCHVQDIEWCPMGNFTITLCTGRCLRYTPSSILERLHIQPAQEDLVAEQWEDAFELFERYVDENKRIFYPLHTAQPTKISLVSDMTNSQLER